MASHSSQTPQYASTPSNLHFSPESCPACGQYIPADKIEEISGKIAARERAQALALTAQLENQYAIEKARADSKSQADLESERQQSAIREMRVRDEAQETARKLLAEKLAENERVHAELTAGWQQQLLNAEAAQRSAAQSEEKLQAEMRELRETSENAVQALKKEAKEREIEIRNDAKCNAESAVAERIATLEMTHRQSEVGLQARISEAETNRIAAEQKRALLAKELVDHQQAKDAEIAKLNQDTAAEILRIRQVATEAAETRFRDTLTALENSVAEANAKTLEAEGKTSTLATQHASAMEANLRALREILEKDKENAINAEKAKNFEESQRLSSKVNDLQRALENKTAEELGEGAEVDLLEALKKEFPDDTISRIRKGTPGADILHIVKFAGKECGSILYDSKNHNQFRKEHVSKLKADQLAAKADHAILSTHKFPQGTRQLHKQDGVLLANPARVVFLATIVRQHLLQVHTLRLSDIERDSKTAALYEFIVSERCSQLLARIEETAEKLLEQQAKEIKWHEKNWSTQGEAIRAIQKAKVSLENQINSIVGTSGNDVPMSEAL